MPLAPHPQSPVTRHPLARAPPHPFTLTPTRPCFSPLRYKNFFRGGWNIFDSLIVFLGTVSLIELACDIEILPPSLGLLRPFRAFRVFRLFKRVPSLAKIMSSLAKAVPGVANAFLIMVIIMCIYAILAVEFFSDFGNEGSYITFQDHKSRGIEAAWSLDVNGVILENRTVSSMTARGFTFGEEYYGTFMRALYTLFQVLTLTLTLK